jgi:hypothetical protein
VVLWIVGLQLHHVYAAAIPVAALMDIGHWRSFLMYQGRALCPVTHKYTPAGVTRTPRGAAVVHLESVVEGSADHGLDTVW